MNRTKSDILRGQFQAVLNDVAALPRPVIARVIPALIHAQTSLASDIRKWLAREDGATRFTTYRYRRMLRAVERSLDAVDQVGGHISGSLKEQSAVVAAMSSRHLEQELRMFADLLKGDIPRVDFRRVAQAGDPGRVLWTRFDRAGVRYSKAATDSLLKTFSVGRARGLSINELSERVELSLGRQFMAQRGWAERLVRTEVMHTYNTSHALGVDELHRQDPDIRKRWDATLDRRRCIVCADGEGEIVKPGDTFSNGLDRPPAHPNCRCVLVPWHSEWEDHPSENWPIRE